MESLKQSETYFEIVSQSVQIDTVSKEIAQELTSLTKTLTHLSLCGNSYSRVFCQQISKIIEKCDQLEKVNFNDIFVSRKKDQIPQAIQVLGQSMTVKNIISLDFSNNAVNPFGAIALSKYLKQATTLRVFLIDNCGLGIDGVQTISEALSQGTPNLQVFAIARNRAEDTGALAIAAALKNLQKLKELYAYQDVIRQSGMLSLLTELSKNCAELQVLDIADNYVKEDVTGALATLIMGSTNLKVLNLSDCNINQNQNEVIVSAFQKSNNQIFEKIGYNYNELTSSLAQRLIDYLSAQCPNLKRLDIKGNEFNKATQQYYQEKVQEQKYLSAFDSDDEEENGDSELTQQFSLLKI